MSEAALRRKVERLGNGTQRRYPPELREEIKVAAARLRAEGVSWSRLSERLGVSIETLRSWLKSSAIVPVSVELPSSLESESIVVVLPNGIRIEGLNVESAITVARALS